MYSLAAGGCRHETAEQGEATTDMMADQVPGPPGRRHETAELEQREARLSARRPRRVFIARVRVYVHSIVHATARDGSPRNAMHSPSSVCYVNTFPALQSQ